MIHFKKFAPFVNRVLIKRVEPITKTKSGIILSEKAQEQLNYGTVVATGPGLTFNNGTSRPNLVEVGQTVLLPSYGGSKVQLADEQEYYIYRDEDILGILGEPTK